MVTGCHGLEVDLWSQEASKAHPILAYTTSRLNFHLFFQQSNCWYFPFRKKVQITPFMYRESLDNPLNYMFCFNLTPYNMLFGSTYVPIQFVNFVSPYKS
jgi:hypothetical protein